MELDSSTLVYVVAVIVYFLYSTFFRKKEPEEAEMQEEEERRDIPPQKAVSFDDLLKEIRREQGEREKDLEGHDTEEAEREWEPEKPRPAPEKRVYNDYRPAQEPKPSYYNEKSSQEKSYQTQPLVKLDDQVDLESTEKIMGEVEDVAGEQAGSNRYGTLLKNPETFREAMVVAEILNRKHFNPLR